MTYPITLEEFKSFFIRESGIMYQSYQEWKPSEGYKAETVVFYPPEKDGGIYGSLIDNNCETPVDGNAWKGLIIAPADGQKYSKGDIVYGKIDGRTLCFWFAVEDGARPDDPRMWDVATEADVCKYLGVPEFPETWAQPGYKRGDLVLYYMNYKPSVFECNVEFTTEPPMPPVSGAKAVTYGDWVINEVETENLNDEILDADIERAMSEAIFKFNENMFTEEKGKLVFLYLTMFFLVYDKQMAASGINGNSAAGPVLSRTVGKMSVSYMESKLFKNYPSYEFLSTNDYGRKAFNLMMPYLRGNVRILRGGSTGE